MQFLLSKRTIPALLISLIAPVPALAESVAEFQGGEIVVSGQKDTAESVTTVRTVTAEEIQRRGARTLDEALTLLPGVSVLVGGDGTPRIQVRGLQTRHVKLLLDGIPINSTYDGNFDPTTIPVEQIAKIKLSAGSSSMLYGDGDLGGAINIITRKGSGPAAINSAGIEMGLDAYQRTWASVGGSDEDLDYFISASKMSRDSYRLSNSYTRTSLEGEDSRTFSDLARTNILANFGLLATRSLNINLVVRHTEGEQGVPPSTRPPPIVLRRKPSTNGLKT